MGFTRVDKKALRSLISIGARAAAVLLKLGVNFGMLRDRMAIGQYRNRELGDRPEPGVCFVDGYHGGITFWNWIIMPGGGTWKIYNWPVVAEPILKQVIKNSSLATVFELDGHTYGWMAKHMPDSADLIKAALDTGRLEIVNGTYAQPLAGTFDDESYIRHFYYGLHEIDQTLSYRVNTFASQEPAFFPQLPQILNSFGYKLALLRTHWAPFGTDPAHSASLIKWQSADESSILTVPRYLFMTYKKRKSNATGTVEVDMHYGSESDDHFMAAHLEPLGFSGYNERGFERFQEAGRQAELDLPLLTRLEDFNLLSGAPLKEAAGLSAMKNIFFLTLQRYLSLLNQEDSSLNHTAETIYYSTDQFPCYFPWGLQGAAPLTAAQEASRKLLEAERLNALVVLSGKKAFTASLDEAWQKALQSQHHDLHICGPWLSRKHNKSMGEVAIDLAVEAQETASQLIKESMCILGGMKNNQQQEKDPGCQDFFIFNSLDHQHRDLVFIEENSEKFSNGSWKACSAGRQIAAQWFPKNGGGGFLALDLEIASFTGVRVTVERDRKGTEKPDAPERVRNEIAYENNYYRACLKPDGEMILTNLNNGDLLQGAYFSAWSEGELCDSRREKNILSMLASGPVADLYLLEGTVAAVPFKEIIYFYKNLPRIDIRATFDFGEGVFLGPQKQESKPGRAYYMQNEKKLNLNLFNKPSESVVAGGTFLADRRKSENFYANGFVALGEEDSSGWVIIRPGSCGYRREKEIGHLQAILAWAPYEWLYASDDSVRVGGSGFTALKGRQTYCCSLVIEHNTGKALVRVANAVANPFSVLPLGCPQGSETASVNAILPLSPGSPVATALFVHGENVYIRICNYLDCEQKFSISNHSLMVRPVSMNLEPEGQVREVFKLAPGKIQTLQIIEREWFYGLQGGRNY